MGLAAAITAALTRPPAERVALAASTSRPVTGQGYGGGTTGLDLTEVFGAAERRGRTAAAAYRCVQIIAGNLAGVPFHVVRGDEPVPDHPVARLFEQPTGQLSGRSMKEVLFARCEWRGQAFVYLDRGPTGEGEATAAHPIYAPCTPIVHRADDGTESLMGYQVRITGGVKIGLLPGEVLWLRYPDPDNAWGALAPWTAAAHAAEVDELAREWQREEMAHGARPAGALFIGDVDESTFRNAQATWRQVASGPKSANRHLLLAGEVKPELMRLGLTATEMGYLDSRRWNLEETALAFGVPRDLVLGGSTFDNQRAAKVALWSDLLRQKMEVLASEVDRQLLPQVEEEAGFDVSEVEALRENTDAIWARAAAGVAAEALTIDEGRAMLGLDPLPGGIGAVTITPYRAAFGGGQPLVTVARSVLGPGAVVRARLTIGGRRGLRALVPVPREPVGQLVVRGQVLGRVGDQVVGAVPALEARAGDRPLAATLRAYDRHETAGRRSVSRLADAMEKEVVRRWKKATERSRLGDDAVVDHVRTTSTGTALVVEVDAPAGQPVVEREVRVSLADLLDTDHWRSRTRDALEPWLAATWDDGGSSLAGRLGVDFDTFHDDVLAAMRARLDVLAGQVTDTTAQTIQDRVLEQGVAEGQSIGDLTAALRSVFVDLRSYRAEAIARTETVGGFNAASRDVAVGSGVVTQREWLSTSDGRVRDTHAELDGHRTSGLDDAYPNGVMFPGDPAGDPGETINCRCVEQYVIPDKENNNDE